jgi:hypothetical protein
VLKPECNALAAAATAGRGADEIAFYIERETRYPSLPSFSPSKW